MKIRKPNEKFQMQNPSNPELQKLQETIEKIDKKIDKLFKVLDYKYTNSK